jgi:hypothetical protein
MEGVDPYDLSSCGWGVIWPPNVDPAVKEALKELLDWRQEQATRQDERFFRTLDYRAGESKTDFLTRHKAPSSGQVNPERMSYYLLLVGGPEAIPYKVQYQLDVQHAVGRVVFDTPDEYAAYAHSVVEAEKRALNLPRRAVFFGVANPDDRATQLSAKELILPLADELVADQKKANWPVDNRWEIETIQGDEATKARLGQILSKGQTPPAFLFTASHGMAFPLNNPRQLPHQGALLCQDWPGPMAGRGKPIPEDYYFSGDDLGEDSRLAGLIAFHFACYGAGTPQLDEFYRAANKAQAQIAPQDFVARLPRRMLAHPKGGALAAVGHVERAWGYSFMDTRAGRQTEVFKSALQLLMKGAPLGLALEGFNERYAELASDLTSKIEDKEAGKTVDDLDLANSWTSHNDARNYVILGDPAVRVMVGDEGKAAAERPVIALSGAGRSAASVAHASQTPAPAAPPAPASHPAPEAPAAPAAQVENYGFVEDARDALKNFAERLSQYLSQALDDATSLEVSTYVSDDLSNVQYRDGKFEGARLRALTRINIDGDTKVLLPEQDGAVDTEVWEVHLQMVQQAQASRTELLKAAVSAVTGLAGMIKPG